MFTSNRPASRRATLLFLAIFSAACTGGLAQTSGQPSAPPSASPSDLNQYVGEYCWVSEPEIATAVYIEDGKLYEERGGRRRQPLVSDPGASENPDRFAVRATSSHVIFLRDSSGAITGLRFTADSDGRILISENRTGSTPPKLAKFREYSRQDAMIPMRDGVKLHVVIFVPADFHPETDAPLPFLMERTPYGDGDENDTDSLNLVKPQLAASGYIFVFEDIRGRYKSEGTFVMNRPIVPHNKPTDIDETTDTHDTIDWLLENIPGNNGRVGVYGVSYPGFLAMMAGIDPHPAVKAILPQAPMTDVWLGDDFFHNGAFRQSYAFDYVQQMEGQKTDVTVDSKEDTFEFFLKHGNFANAAAAAKMSDLPTARAFIEQPAYTKFWRDMAVQYHLTSVTVPTLEVGGYWDQEDMWGTQAEYAALKPHDGAHQVFLVLGSWNHGEWEESTARKLGSNFGLLDFGHATGIEYRSQFEAPFFEKYLKDRPGFDLEDTASFRTGTNEWERYPVWPPVAGFQSRRAYLEPDGLLSFTPPSDNANAVAATYISNPADPIPYRHRPIQSTYGKGSKWYTWLVENQRFVSGRKDLANFSTPVLDHDVTITGDVMADLFASTSGSDGDWIVKLIDVYPDDASGNMAGFELMVADEIFRGRYLHSFQEAEAIKPNEVNELRWSLHGVDHVFQKGHRIMVEVQSTWFPLYDRNPQTFVPNIMTAPGKAYKPETITIYSSPKYPSRVEFSVAQ